MGLDSPGSPLVRLEDGSRLPSPQALACTHSRSGTSGHWVLSLTLPPLQKPSVLDEGSGLSGQPVCLATVPHLGPLATWRDMRQDTGQSRCHPATVIHPVGPPLGWRAQRGEQRAGIRGPQP